jgi:RNA polymerase sigma-70 factor (ECF subfamily)
MSTPANQPLDLNRYRTYLLLLARGQLDPRWRARVDASDLIQQTLLEAHRDISRFDGQTEAQVAGWLRQILANVARDQSCRKRDVHRERSLERALEESSARLEAWLADGQLSPSGQVERNEQLLQLAGALVLLPDTQREVVELRYLKGWALDRIAAHLGKTAAAVAGLLHRGLSQLRKLLTPAE